MDSVTYMVGGQYGLHHVLVVIAGDAVTITDLDGEILIEHTRPATGVTYVGNGRPRGPRPKPENLTEVLTHQLSPKS